MSEKSLELVTHPQAFFHELVMTALGNQKLQPAPETEFYLVNLLERFMFSERLRMQPLVCLFQEALEEPVPELQRRLFQQWGDTSLYVAWLFQASVDRKLVDVDYYIEVGGGAYRRVAARADGQPSASVFEE